MLNLTHHIYFNNKTNVLGQLITAVGALVHWLNLVSAPTKLEILKLWSLLNAVKFVPYTSISYDRALLTHLWPRLSLIETMHAHQLWF